MRFVPKWMMLALVALATTALHARENAVLRTGFTISHDHHQQIGTRTRLFLKADSEEYVDIESEKIVSFEPDESPIPAPLPVRQFTGPSSLDLDQIVEKAARENQLDSDFIHALILAESEGKTTAVSAKGAQGLMQLMPDTAAKLGVKNSFDANENVAAGAKYIRELLARYNNDPLRALAAYNAGAGRVQQYNGVPPYRETRAYVAKIIREFNRRKLEQERLAKASKKPTRVAAAKQPTASGK
ncbi:MAG: lytic transglycosylase domain-containing protein [Acidobacteria bacterium]|nr:MAG: lytic transglycosylase domain-containing protein [Acidobacteriota bacterium]PYY22923.1 MAG: lytic transglycosylase domain-containing protein [Acidobacteriota bacterium]